MNPVAFIDDDPTKKHRWIVGVPVRGAIDQLEAALVRYAVDEVILSSPSINGSSSAASATCANGWSVPCAGCTWRSREPGGASSGVDSAHCPRARGLLTRGHCGCRQHPTGRHRRPGVHVAGRRRSPLRRRASSPALQALGEPLELVALGGRDVPGGVAPDPRTPAPADQSWLDRCRPAACRRPRRRRRRPRAGVHRAALVRRAGRADDSRRQLRPPSGVVSRTAATGCGARSTAAVRTPPPRS